MKQDLSRSQQMTVNEEETAGPAESVVSALQTKYLGKWLVEEAAGLEVMTGRFVQCPRASEHRLRILT